MENVRKGFKKSTNGTTNTPESKTAKKMLQRN